MVALRSCFPMLPHCLPAGNSYQQQIPDGAPPRRPCQQQLCHGAPASNNSVTALPASSIFPMALRHGASAINSSATAPLPATNLIRRRRVLRFG